MEAAQTANNADKYIELLHENNGLLMMIKPAMGSQLQFSFQHNYHGSTLSSQQKSLIAITGFDQGIPIEIETKHLHKSSNKTDTPKFDDIIETGDPATLGALIATADNKVKFKSSVLLIPLLIEGVINETDLSAENIFRALTTRIRQREEQLFIELKNDFKNNHNFSEEVDDAAYEPLRQNLREESEQGYGGVIYLLYKLLTKEDTLHAINSIPVTSMEKQ